MRNILYKKGFTLIEMLLSVGLLGIIVGMSVPVVQQYQTQRSSDTEVDQAIALIRRAQVLARSSYHNDQWGIHVDTDMITLFEGDNFLTRDSDFDEQVTYRNLVGVVDNDTIIFSQGQGIPDVSAEIILTTTNNYELTITINQQGVVSLSRENNA